MSAHRLAILGLLLLVGGCGESDVAVAPQPKEPDSHAIGFYCRMALTEHTGPKGQLLLKGWQEPLWFPSVHDAFVYLTQDLVNENEIAGFWVNDMGQGTWEQPAPGSWIGPKSAFYVVESQKTAAMGGNEAVPFKKRAQAQAFVSKFGGRIVGYQEALAMVAELPSSMLNEGGTQ